MKNFPCFIHIEKCAGTTLNYSLIYHLPGYVVLKAWYKWSNEPGNFYISKELKLLKLFFPFLSGIGGHTSRTYASYEAVLKSEIDYFTFVRDPIARYMSHFNHQVNRVNSDWTLKSFVKEKRFNNYITRRIAGKEDIDLAIKRINEDYSFVGLFENFDESLVLMNHYLFLDKKPLYYVYKNDSKKETKVIFENLDLDTQNAIIENNKMDIELYEYVKTVIYPRYLKCYNGDFEKELEDFKKVNSEYSYNKIKYYLLKSSKIYTNIFLQKVIHRFLKKTVR